MQWLILAFLIFPAALATAQEMPPAAEVCAGCHGTSERLPSDPAYPILSGQQYYYLYVQLKDFKAGRRENEIMQGVVADLDRKAMKAIAQYWSEQPWPRTGFSYDANDRKLAEQAVVSAECTACHLGGFEGNSRVPRLRNQQPGYLQKTMLDYKYRRRLNSPNMLALFKTIPDAQIEALARYLSGL